jgi:phosphonate transport system substrate-binding protein
MTHFSALRSLKNLLAISMTAGLMLTAASASAQNTPGVLRVSAIPDEAPTELQRKFKPLGEYLSKATGLKVEFTPVTDYAASVEGLINHKLDMVWFGGFTFVQANDRSKGQVVPLVQRAEDEKFRSVFITASPNIKPPDAAFLPAGQ